jgi:hypothetical protein
MTDIAPVLLDAIRALANTAALLDVLSATESPLVHRAVQDALCHVQLGLDLLDELHPRSI